MKVTNLQSFCFVNYSPHRFTVGYGKEYCTLCLSQVGYIYVTQFGMEKSKSFCHILNHLLVGCQ